MSRRRVVGLRRHKATNTHYATLPDGKFKYFAKDPITAESQYAAWLASHHANHNGDPANRSSNISQSASGGNASLSTVRAVFNAYLAFLKKNRGKKHFDDMKPALQEFCDKCVPAKTRLTDLKKEHFVSWRESLHTKVKDGKVSAFWANKRTRAVKSAFRRAIKDYELTISKAHVDEFLFTLYQMPEPMPDDAPFSPDEVKRLLDCASTQIQAMILLALNGCLDNIDVSRIQWENIDLNQRDVNYARQKPSWKTTRPRRFRLWDRTAQALEKLAPKPSRRTGRIFSTKYGREWVRPGRDSLAQEIAKIKREARIVHDRGFRNLRKSATTAAAVAGVGEVTIEMLLGHASPKMWRRYAGVVPPAVEEAVLKIERHFFENAAAAKKEGDRKAETEPASEREPVSGEHDDQRSK